MRLWDDLWIDGHLATMQENGESYGAIRDAALAVEDGCIAWVGRRQDLPAAPQRCAHAVHSLAGGWATPGLIDCHTHAVFAGSRVHELEMRQRGVSYADIAAAGGGIAATVRSTRQASIEGLVAASAPRIRALLAEGVTTLEIKSGYGLELDAERRILQAAQVLAADLDFDLCATFLGAHAVPQEHREDPSRYVDLLCEEMLPAIAADGIAQAVDAYCERIAFDADQTARIFAVARRLGLPVKLHADQLSDGGGAALAARYNALSADHLEYTSEDGVRALASAGCTAVLLPGAYYSLGETRPPPVTALRRHGVSMAVATDLNPGTSPLCSLLTAMNMACMLFGLTPEEALAGSTRCAARALALAADRGTLRAGTRADFAVWDISEPAELCYWVGANPIRQVVRGGRVRPRSSD